MRTLLTQTFCLMCNMQVLVLSSNEISDPGITALADALGKGALASCQKLNLSCNQIGDAGLSAFSRALGSGALAQLETVDFGRNPASKEAQERIEQILRDRREPTAVVSK